MQIPSFLLDEWLNEYHFASPPPEFDLASSTGPLWTAREILGLMTPDERELFNETPLVYSAATGSRMLRQAIGDLHGVEAEQVQIVTGVSEAFLILFFLAAESGANVILPAPVYPPIAVEARLLGLETRFYQLRRENDFGIDLDEIKKLIDAKTKLLLVNSPHNPTGATVSSTQMRDLHDLAVEQGIQFVSDEVYHPIYHQDKTASASVLAKAIVLGSFSKALSLSGLRVGWIIDRDPERVQNYANARSYFTISNSPLSEG
ncbi:MAG: pyridoxal phosphate-dependent aminotransferase, partial [Pyrinomonadaceae bacterium]|nr:pyridoxal phosphate-dependent aminotransferase [Pyrinomonadaceae bacterium]